MGQLDNIFDPKTVAFIGATEREDSIGRQIMTNLLIGKDKRTIFPVNPHRESIMGIKCFSSITKVPEHIDLAVIATPAKTVPKIFDECGQSGIDGVVIISAGFRETGEEGERLEEDIKNQCEKYDTRILGPNCLGFIKPRTSLNAAFSRNTPKPGEIAFISQSAALGSAMIDWAVSARIGFSMFVSLGLMLDIDFGDLIDYLGRDPHTRSILIYMEGIGCARRFVSASRGFARTKPIIVLKSGRYTESAKAARSHIGALAGHDDVYTSVFKRLGLLRVYDIEDLFNCARVLSRRKLPEGARLGIITNAGGPGIIAADVVKDYGGDVADLSKDSIHAFETFFPEYCCRENPIDILEEANIERYEKVLDICLSDPNIDGIIVIHTPQPAAQSLELAKKIVEKSEKNVKPILTVWMGGDESEEAGKYCYENDVLSYPTPCKAVRTYMQMFRYKRNLELLYETPEELPTDLAPPKNHLKLIIKRAIREDRFVLTVEESDKFLEAYGIQKPEAYLSKSEDETTGIALNIGYPVVLKINSPDVVHKTSIGGVVLDVDSEDRLRSSYRKMLEKAQSAIPNVRIDGVYVQKMMTNIDHELFLGAKKDRDFGTIILFGQGGKSIDLIQNFTIALPPLNQNLAKMMIEENKIFKTLSKDCGEKPSVNLRSLEETVVQFSNLIVDFPEIAEIEINPIVASGNEVRALDSRIIIDPEAFKDRHSYSHLMISPYPTKYVTPWRLKNGTEVIIRPIRPEDERIEFEFINGLSKETKRLRFFKIIKKLSHTDLARFCNIDYDRELAIIAEIREDRRKKIIGVARLILEPYRKCGEFAVVVADEYQRQGLGTKLVDMLIEIAAEKRLDSIYCIILSENKNMIRLCKKMGFNIKIIDEVVGTLNLN